MLDYLAVKEHGPHEGADSVLRQTRVGKASLGKSIARALGANRAAALGSMHDEAEIRGIAGRTSAPSWTDNQGLKRAESNDPVCMLDGFVVNSTRFSWNPSSALMILDPGNHMRSRSLSDMPLTCRGASYYRELDGSDTGTLRDRMEIINT